MEKKQRILEYSLWYITIYHGQQNKWYITTMKPFLSRKIYGNILSASDKTNGSMTWMKWTNLLVKNYWLLTIIG